MEWFRFYDEVLDDPKVQRLPAALFRDWINILCLCNRNDPRGVLPSVDDVAFGLRSTTTKAKGIIKKLHEAELLVTSQGVTYPNGWHKRQRVSDDVAKRVAESRARNKPSGDTGNVTGNNIGNVTSNTPETLPHVRATEQNRTDTEQITTASAVVEGAEAPAKPKAKRATQIPDDWCPSDGLRNWAIAEGFVDADVDQQFPQFVDHFRSKGEPRKDWDAGFRTWMRNARSYGHTFAKPAQPPKDSGNSAYEALLKSIAEDEQREHRQSGTRTQEAHADSVSGMAEGRVPIGGGDIVSVHPAGPGLRSIARRSG